LTGQDFYDRIDTHPAMACLGVQDRTPDPLDAEIYILTRRGIVAVTLRSILANTWTDLEAVLTGKRNAVIMIHISRVVGYYGQIRNWNSSKLAELRDRQRGDYALPEAA
jgi:hypothetical protein